MGVTVVSVSENAKIFSQVFQYFTGLYEHSANKNYITVMLSPKNSTWRSVNFSYKQTHKVNPYNPLSFFHILTYTVISFVTNHITS